MTDVFGTDASVGGTFRGNKFTLTVKGSEGNGDVPFEGALVQQLQLSYQRQVTRFWALGTRAQYYIEGRTEGQGQISRIVGPQGLIDNLASVLSNFCTVANRTATLSSTGDKCNRLITNGQAVDAQSGLSLTLGGIIANGITFGADANQFVVNSSISVMFASLSKGGPVNA